MAQGDLKGTKTGNAASIPNPFVISTGTDIAVQVGDLLVALCGQQTALTVTACADNLGNTYTAQNAGTDAGAITGRMFWSVATVGGTLTQFSFTTTSSTNNVAGAGAVFEGPFLANASQPDANPANNNNTDNTSPFTCPATGTLAQAREQVIAWMVGDTNNVWSATSPNLKAAQSTSAALANAIIGYQTVSSTTTLSPAFTSAASTTVSVQGTVSFKLNTDIPYGEKVYDTPAPAETPGNDLKTLTFWNIGLYGVIEQAPFAQVDWPNPIYTPSRDFGWTGSILPLFTPVQPVDTTTQLRTPHFSNPRQAQFFTTEHYYNVNLRSVVSEKPFNQQDWPILRGYQPLLQTWSWSYNLNLIGQDQLPAGDRHYDLPPQPQYPTNLRTATGGPQPQAPEAAPFNQEDWPLPRAPKQLVLGWTWSYNLNLIGQDQLPPGKILLGMRVQQPQTVQTWISSAIRAAAAVQAPFNQFSWPIAQQRQQPYGWIQPLSTLLKSIKPPTNQTDWPILRAHSQFNRGFTASYNLNLIGKDLLPFRQQDWPLARARRGIDIWVTGINVNLFPPVPPPVFPHNQFYWPLPGRYPVAMQQASWWPNGGTFAPPFIPPVPPPTPPEPSTTQGAPGLEWQPYDRIREPGPIGWR